MAKAKPTFQTFILEQKILNKIYVIRGEKVMLDRDLAQLYNVETRVKSEYQKESKSLPKRLYVPAVRKRV